MNTDTRAGQLLNCRAHVHRIAAQSIELCHHKHIGRFKPIQQLRETGAFGGGNGAADRFFDDPPLVDRKAGGLYFSPLVLGRLVSS